MWSDHVGSLAQFVLLSDSSQSEVSHTNVWPHTHTHRSGHVQVEVLGDKRRHGLLICLTPNQLSSWSTPPLHHRSSSSSCHTGELVPHVLLQPSFISAWFYTFISCSCKWVVISKSLSAPLPPRPPPPTSKFLQISVLSHLPATSSHLRLHPG